MSQIVERTKYLITNVPHDEGIKGLILLEQQTTQKMKYIPRLACLSLMQMCHDWQGIKKLIVQWKFICKFGKDLVIRMRKRVGQQPGIASDNQEDILKQLDRLNDKNWRQFSPKRDLPDYAELVLQHKIKQYKPILSSTLPTIIQEKHAKQNQNSNNSMHLSADKDKSVIFSKVSQLPKNQQNKDKQIFTRGVFSKQLNPKGQGIEKHQGRAEKSQALSYLLDKKPKPDQLKRASSLQDLHKKSTPQPQKLYTPLKQQQKNYSLKYGVDKQKIPQQNQKDQFSFSVVKTRQQVQGGFSNKKQQSMIKSNQLNDSFLNFSNQQKYHKQKSQPYNLKNQPLLLQQLPGHLPPKQHYKTTNRYKQYKVLYSQQQLALISIGEPPPKYIKHILKAEGKSPLDMLKIQLLSH